MNEREQEFEGLSLEDILKEFGSGEQMLTEEEQEMIRGVEDAEAPAEPENETPQVAEASEEPAEESSGTDSEHAEQPGEEFVPAEEPGEVETSAEAPETEEPVAAVTDETVRLDEISMAQAMEESQPQSRSGGVTDETIRLDDLSEVSSRGMPALGEPTDDDMDLGEVAPAPILFRPKSRLRELKRKLIAGPEKRYYELTEIGVGKVQIAMLLCLVLIALSVFTGLMYAGGYVPENRMRLLIFSQVFFMLVGGLLGSQQMLEGICDLFSGKFTTNTMLMFTFCACCADSVFCLQEQRVPICGAFTLEVFMALWATYHRRTAEMGQMDTMRKAVRLDSVVKCADYHEGRFGIQRGEGQVEDFMEHYAQTPAPEKVQNVYALVSFLLSIAVAVAAGILHAVTMGVQIFSTTLLVAVPASFFVSITRPMAILERRLHRMGTVLCGWRGIKGLKGKGFYPLQDTDIFPAGSTKMNGVKFYGKRDPETVIAYAASLMRANGGTLAPIFDQLLDSRNGIRYSAENLQFYGNGGIGGEICEEPVLMGTLDFLKEMGVEIPEGVMVKQAVYVSIDGELSGLFAISYTRMKFAAKGLTLLCSYRKLKPLIIAEDFMITGPFLKEKFGVRTRRMVFPSHVDRVALAEKKAAEDAPALALTTQEGLAPAVYAITGARALRTAWNLGVVIHLVGGILGLLIMAALAVVGSVELLTPIHILAYQLVWMIPGLLVTLWPRTV